MSKTIAIFAGHYPSLWETKHSKGIYTNLEADGVYEEYDTNIDIARRTVDILERVDGLTVLFPQGEGREMKSLKERVDYCNDHNVDTAIFIHSNAASRDATGACAFYWKGSEDGLRFANYYRDEMKKLGFPLWSDGTYPCSHDQHNWSNFYVVEHTNMPVILTENFFFTNPTELKKYLLNPINRDKIAEVQAKASCRYLNLEYPEQKGEYDMDLTQDQKDIIEYLKNHGITDGKKPAKPVNQMYLWEVAYKIMTAKGGN